MSSTESNRSSATVTKDRKVGELVARGIRSWTIALVVIISVACGIFAAEIGSDTGDFFAVTASAFALAATAGLIGGFFGLLFGMPREVEPRNGTSTTNARYAFNSNLLKVSDWVTTILVGLSLVSLRSIPGGLSSFSDRVSPALGARASSGPFGVFIAGASFAAVFLLLYVWTAVPLRSHLENEAFDTEQQWASMLSQVAERKPPEEIAESLKALTPAVLERIRTDADRTPPLLRDLAEQEQARRAAPPD